MAANTDILDTIGVFLSVSISVFFKHRVSLLLSDSEPGDAEDSDSDWDILNLQVHCNTNKHTSVTKSQLCVTLIINHYVYSDPALSIPKECIILKQHA